MQMGVKMIKSYRVTKQKKDNRENYLKEKFEASRALKKFGPRSIN